MGMAAAGQSRDQESIGALHQTILTVDSHVDTPMRMPAYDIGKRHPLGIGMVDLPRMEDGHLAAAVFAAFLEQGELNDEARLRAIEFGRAKVTEIARQVNANPANARLVKSADDIEAAFREGKKAVIVSMENGYQIGLDLDNLNRFFDQGVRILTLTHKSDNDICDSSTDDKHPEDRGLSEFGRRLIERMNGLGMTIDVSHASDQTFSDVIRLSRAPIIASHSSARGVQEHPQNLSDEQLRALRTNGGVVGITFVLPFLKREIAIPEVQLEIQAVNARVVAKGGWPALKPEDAATFQKEMREIKYRYPQSWASVKDVVDHIDHVVRTIGTDHVGIGSDFDGGGYLADCRDVSEYLNLTAEMVRRGYSEADIRKIWGGNYLRVLRRIQELATPRAPTPSEPGR
jgi:membrane dipeptidase